MSFDSLFGAGLDLLGGDSGGAIGGALDGFLGGDSGGAIGDALDGFLGGDSGGAIGDALGGFLGGDTGGMLGSIGSSFLGDDVGGMIDNFAGSEGIGSMIGDLMEGDDGIGGTIGSLLGGGDAGDALGGLLGNSGLASGVSDLLGGESSDWLGGLTDSLGSSGGIAGTIAGTISQVADGNFGGVSGLADQLGESVGGDLGGVLSAVGTATSGEGGWFGRLENVIEGAGDSFGSPAGILGTVQELAGDGPAWLQTATSAAEQLGEGNFSEVAASAVGGSSVLQGVADWYGDSGLVGTALGELGNWEELAEDGLGALGVDLSDVGGAAAALESLTSESIGEQPSGTESALFSLIDKASETIDDAGSRLEEAATDFAAADYDGDNLDNAQELRIGTNPMNADTDGDGLADDSEVLGGRSDPLRSDTDGDRIGDLLEDTVGDESLDAEAFVESAATGVPEPDLDFEAPLGGVPSEIDQFDVEFEADPTAPSDPGPTPLIDDGPVFDEPVPMDNLTEAVEAAEELESSVDDLFEGLE